MTINIINDCRDDNAAGRQRARAASLFGVPVNLVGVKTDLEAAGNILDILDAVGEEKSVLLVNVAPRHGMGKNWPNGTPFGYFWYKQTLVVSSVAGLTLSLVKKFKLATEIKVLDIPTVLQAVGERAGLSTAISAHITKGQFRSFDFVPRVAKWIIDGFDIPSEAMSITDIADAPRAVWWVDCFGNCKTTLTGAELNGEVGQTINTSWGAIKREERLKDVPNGELAMVVGSSGIEEHRFVEILVQGESVADKLNITSGAIVN